MRCDQYIGLTTEAQEFLSEHEITPEPCSCCKRPFPPKLEQICTYRGINNTEYPLNRHFLMGGRYADEFLQADPWSSGPMFFIGLRVSDGQEFSWSEEEILRSES